MICPVCHNQIPDYQTQCPVCQAVLRPAGASHIPSVPMTGIVCPHCHSPLSAAAQTCPVCQHAIIPSGPPASPVLHGQSQPGSRSGRRRSRRPNQVVGTIIDVLPLQQEPRDVSWLQALVVTSMTALIVVIAFLISTRLLSQVITIMILLFIVGLFFRGNFVTQLMSMMGMGCLMQILLVPLRLIGWLGRSMIEAYYPRINSHNMREVREYRIDPDPMYPHIDAFIVKGNLSPRTLRQADTVRVTVVYRHGRPYLRRGFLRQPNGEEVRLYISEPPIGLRWLLVSLILLGLVAIFLLPNGWQ